MEVVVVINGVTLNVTGNSVKVLKVESGIVTQVLVIVVSMLVMAVVAALARVSVCVFKATMPDTKLMLWFTVMLSLRFSIVPVGLFTTTS